MINFTIYPSTAIILREYEACYFFESLFESLNSKSSKSAYIHYIFSASNTSWKTDCDISLTSWGGDNKDVLCASDIQQNCTSNISLWTQDRSALNTPFADRNGIILGHFIKSGLNAFCRDNQKHWVGVYWYTKQYKKTMITSDNTLSTTVSVWKFPLGIVPTATQRTSYQNVYVSDAHV